MRSTFYVALDPANAAGHRQTKRDTIRLIGPNGFTKAALGPPVVQP